MKRLARNCQKVIWEILFLKVRAIDNEKKNYQITPLSRSSINSITQELEIWNRASSNKVYFRQLNSKSNAHSSQMGSQRRRIPEQGHSTNSIMISRNLSRGRKIRWCTKRERRWWLRTKSCDKGVKGDSEMSKSLIICMKKESKRSVGSQTPQHLIIEKWQTNQQFRTFLAYSFQIVNRTSLIIFTQMQSKGRNKALNEKIIRNQLKDLRQGEKVRQDEN